MYRRPTTSSTVKYLDSALMNKPTIEVKRSMLEQASLCEPILQSLPEWFGIEEAIAQYIRDIEKLPTLLALSEGKVIGFLSLKQHNEYSAEIYVIAVHPKFLRLGVGRVLVDSAEADLRQAAVEYLQVKALGTIHPDQNYAKTRAFYLSIGFKPLEEFTGLWKGNPCLQMVKRL